MPFQKSESRTSNPQVQVKINHSSNSVLRVRLVCTLQSCNLEFLRLLVLDCCENHDPFNHTQSRASQNEQHKLNCMFTGNTMMRTFLSTGYNKNLRSKSHAVPQFIMYPAANFPGAKIDLSHPFNEFLSSKG
jgi:hypothetical protein